MRLLNSPSTRFFISLISLATIWFFVYGILLSPKRIIDRPLTNFFALSTAAAVNFFSPQSMPLTSWVESPEGNRAANLMQGGKKVFGIWDACNGIDLMFIYTAVIVLLPNNVKRKLLFISAGNLLLILLNIIRMISLFFIFKYYKSFFEISHHYLFTILMYSVIFILWILFIRKGAYAQAN